MSPSIRFSIAILVLATLCSIQASADTPIAVTVYNNDLGVIRERRTIEIGRGESVYSFTDVAALIDPTSVHLRAMGGGGLEVLEQNFEYDLLSSEKLYRKYFEKRVEVYVKEGEVLTGTLLSVAGGSFVIRSEREEKLVVVASGSVQHVELLGTAEGFVTRPTLVWTIQNDGNATREVEIEYLTRGLSWHAEYVALADEESRSIDFAGWVSVDNRSGADYEDARLKLIAGDVNRAARYMPTIDITSSHARAAKGPQVTERELFEYHLYEIGRPTTIRNQQVKQISFLANTRVPVHKEFLYEPRKQSDKIQVILELKNSKEDGLGIALPAGKVRVFQDDGQGGSEFIGEDRIDHTPRNEKMRLLIGYAFDLVAERKILDTKRLGKSGQRQTVEIKLRNRKDDEVEIKVLEWLGGDWTIENETHSHRKEDAHKAEWKVAVPADGETVISYTVRIDW